jgi:hypothetical protein
LLEEAIEFAKNIDEEIRICGGVLSCLVREMEGINLVEAIMDYQDCQQSRGEGYKKIHRQAINLLIDHLLEVWIIRKGILRPEAIGRARVEIREAWERDQRNKREALEKAVAEYRKIEQAKIVVEELEGKLPADEYQSICRWLETRFLEKEKEVEEIGRRGVRAMTLSDKLMGLLMVGLSSAEAPERKGAMEQLGKPIVDEELMFDVHAQLNVRIRGDETLDAGDRAKLLTALDELMSRVGRV